MTEFVLFFRLVEAYTGCCCCCSLDTLFNTNGYLGFVWEKMLSAADGKGKGDGGGGGGEKKTGGEKLEVDGLGYQIN